MKINSFRTLEANQKFTTNWEAFIQEKTVNLSKDAAFCPAPFPSPLPSSTAALHTNSLATMVAMKTSSPVADVIGLETFQKVIPTNLLLFPQSGGILTQSSLCKTVLYPEHLLKNISGSCLISQLLKAAISVGLMKDWPKNLKRSEMFIGGFEQLQHIPRTSQCHMHTQCYVNA